MYETTWHHLDEDPSQSYFENLVPLRLDYNANIEQSPELLSAEEWRQAARNHERHSRYALAYGAARTGAFIEAKRGHPTQVIELAADCVRCLRPLARLDLIADVLKRTVNPIQSDSQARHGVSPIAYARLCDEITNLFREHGSLQESQVWFEFTLSFLERLHDWDEISTLQTQLFRHQSFAFLERGALEDARKWMDFAEHVGSGDGSWQELGKKMSQELWLVRAALRNKDFDNVVERLERLEKERRIQPPEQLVTFGLTYPLGVDIWMEGALQGVWAEAELAQGMGTIAHERVDVIRPLYRGSRAIVPTIGGSYPIVLKALGHSPLRSGRADADWAQQLMNLERVARDTAEGVRRRLSVLPIVRPRPLPKWLRRLPG